MALLDAAAPPAGGPTLFGMSMKQVSLITSLVRPRLLVTQSTDNGLGSFAADLPKLGADSGMHLPRRCLPFRNMTLTRPWQIMHYSRIMPPVGDHRYFTSTAVFLNEVIKLSICLTCSIAEVSRTLAPSTPATVIFEQIFNSVFSGDGWKLAIPATLYTLQNTLQYVAVGNLDAVHFQVLYQLKILTTAVFSVTMLRRALGMKRWISLFILTLGVSIVSLPQPSANHAGSSSASILLHDTTDHFFPRSVHELGQAAEGAAEVARELTKRAADGLAGVGGEIVKRSASYQGIQEDQDPSPLMNYSIGLSAVLVAAVASGLAGVYFEKMLKDSATPASVWTRNIQLSFYSLFPALAGVIFIDGEDIAKHGFFEGYNWVVWTAIVFQAVGGVLASLCINYADNIAKNFAASISIVISFLFSVWFFNFEVNFTFIIGTALVLASTYLYSIPDRKGRPPPITIASYEKAMVDPAYTPAVTDETKLNLDPLDAVRGMGLSTSRPSSPMLHHHRAPSARGKNRDD
ncbi:UDP-galactose transporter 1 [Colletotrichum spaethianum]|uniref:UDP-galactose transporter 1 n=1 Tax=Colletotrichum spaethianum TaxID=700344 RepID=A0AA37PHB0_9PEZI|nr:UDP-galactose transporter 1 [Colletotrichum spaethianum]GKT52326.1 UDP-galactose transporter 1 [Colletotrichum spaethianum]